MTTASLWGRDALPYLPLVESVKWTPHVKRRYVTLLPLFVLLAACSSSQNLLRLKRPPERRLAASCLAAAQCDADGRRFR